jgi:DNA-binding NarL/FixJ family response regulator
MVAWQGVYVDGRRGFSGHSRAALADVLCRLSAPVLLAAQLALPGEARQLAPRQRAILAHVARGATNKQIARDLDISPATVKTTLERLFRASRTANRAALVDWWRSGDAPEHVPVR